MTVSPPRRRVLVVVALAAATLAYGAVPARAANGTYTQILCGDPDTGQGVAANGALPSGLTNPWDGNYNYQLALGLASCGPGPMSGSRGVPLLSGETYTTNTPGTGIGGLVYTPAPNTSVLEDDLYLAGYLVTVADHETVTLHGGPWNEIFAQPSALHCEWAGAGACFVFGSFADPFAGVNRVDWHSPPANGFALTMGCTIPDSSWTCYAAGQQVRLYGGKITLRDEANPVGASAPTGGLTIDDPLQGSEDVTMGGSDVGAGLYRVLLLVDNHVAQAQSMDTDGGSCVDVNPANSDLYEFASNRPCRLATSGTYAFDTRAVPDGRHNVKVQLEDAAGNATTVVDRTVTIRNAPPSVGEATPQSVGVGGGVGSAVPNGTNGGAAVLLTASGAKVVHVAHGRSVTLSGHLTTATGAPVGAAKIDVLHGPAVAAPALVNDLQITTGDDGSFRYVVPPGVSRIVRFGYRATLGDADFARTVDVRIHVRAALSFHLSTSILHNGQTLMYHGTLLGPANSGRFVEVQVHNGRRWQAICSLRTSHRGHFSCAHHFTRTFVSTTYAFRAVVRSQAGLPYDPAHSRTRKVHVRP